MTYIDKTQLEKEIDDNYCSHCHHRKNFNSLDCMECNIHSLSLSLEDIPSFDDFVPRDKVNKLIKFCADRMSYQKCPYPYCHSCPDDDGWNCEDCWEEYLKEKFLI